MSDTKTIPLHILTQKKATCRGCRDDFYNCNGRSSEGHCWSLPSAKRVWRWAIGMQTPMDRKKNFRRVLVNSCFHGDGPYRDIYLKRLPAHLGGVWADKREQKEEESK